MLKLYLECSSEEDFAQKIGVTHSAVSLWLQKSRIPNSSNIEKILKKFSLKPEDIGATYINVDNENSFASTLNKLINENNISQQDLANNIFVEKSTISNYCSGKRFPDLNKLIKIAKYFNVSLDYLITGICTETDISANIGFNNVEFEKLIELKKSNDLQKKPKGFFKINNPMPSELDILKFVILNTDLLKVFKDSIDEYIKIDSERKKYETTKYSDKRKVKEKFDGDERKLEMNLSNEIIKIYKDYSEEIKKSFYKKM